MTPTEKVNELVNKYLNASFNCKGCDMPFCDIGCTQLSLHEAKECALIAVDEVIEQEKQWIKATGKGNSTFWKAVKKEITHATLQH